MQNPSRSLIFAHRGANREAVENTRAAFDKALNYPIQGIETDVQLSRDNVPVLWHDRFLNKLGLPDKHIDDFSYAQLRNMNVPFDEQTSEPLMSLQDFVVSYAQRCQLLVEVKNRDWEELARHQLKMRLCLQMLEGVPSAMLSSFNLASLIYAHDCAPSFPLIYNLEPEQCVSDIHRCLRGQPYLHGFCVHVSQLNQDLVALLRKHEKNIAVYTCNSDAEIRLALDLEVDILISDYPAKALAMRRL